jgi:hypothetical protein
LQDDILYVKDSRVKGWADPVPSATETTTLRCLTVKDEATGYTATWYSSGAAGPAPGVGVTSLEFFEQEGRVGLLVGRDDGKVGVLWVLTS